MRAEILIASAVVVAALLAAPAACANEAPTIVVPGRPGVPVMWFGQDLSGAVIEGERGLDRPGNPITIIPGGSRVLWAPTGGYFPTTGRPPRYGRDEREPPANRSLPRPAESYFRTWGAQSMPTPATLPPDVSAPPIVVVPQINGQPRNDNPRPMPRRGN